MAFRQANKLKRQLVLAAITDLLKATSLFSQVLPGMDCILGVTSSSRAPQVSAVITRKLNQTMMVLVPNSQTQVLATTRLRTRHSRHATDQTVFNSLAQASNDSMTAQTLTVD